MKQQLDLYRQLNTPLVPIQANSKAYDKLAWQERGYRSLADLKQRGIKVPDIIAWWESGARKKERNTAIATTDHLFVLDFDSEDQYWRFCSEMPILAQTMTVKSPNGYHCYFRTQEAIPSNLKSKWPEVEVKASGDCILCPPSRIDLKWYHRIGIIRDPLVIPRAASIGLLEERERPFSFTCANDIEPILSKERSKPQGERSDRLYRGVIRDIKERLSMLELAMKYSELQPSGGGCFIGLCPAHDDDKPSFRVAGNRCGCFRQDCRMYDKRGLDIIEFHSRLHQVDYRGSIAILAEGLGLI